MVEAKKVVWELDNSQNLEIPFNPEEIDRVRYFKQIYRSFQKAEKATKQLSYFYNFGGYIICLRFAGDALVEPLTSALAHLATEPTTNPALTICVWDTISTRIKMPLLVSMLLEIVRLRWWVCLDPRQEIKGYQSERIMTTFNPWENILNAIDTKKNIAIYWIKDGSQLPYYEKGSPFRTILNWWMQKHQRQYLHAGAIGFADGGILLVGKGGSGKSTTALACINSELTYASDDYCLLGMEPIPYIYSLYNTGKLKSAEDLQRFPHLVPLITNSDRLDREKVTIFLYQNYPQKIISGFPLRAIFLPKVTGKKETNLKPTTSIEALKAIAPSTIFQLAGSGSETMETLVKLVKLVPCYVLEVGTDMNQIPQIIRAFLQQYYE
jgi:hypothetical protein